MGAAHCGSAVMPERVQRPCRRCRCDCSCVLARQVRRLARQAYLATIGRNKLGFGVAGTGSDGKPVCIGGIRGLVERNIMRYYLAIEAFLGAMSAAPQVRLDRRLRDWFAASERYPRQLHELEQEEYLDMKRKEYRRQQSERQAPPA